MPTNQSAIASRSFSISSTPSFLPVSSVCLLSSLGVSVSPSSFCERVFFLFFSRYHHKFVTLLHICTNLPMHIICWLSFSDKIMESNNREDTFDTSFIALEEWSFEDSESTSHYTKCIFTPGSCSRMSPIVNLFSSYI